MSENPIAISSLNDFIFCPVSIYFHGLEADEEKVLSQDSYQINGTAAHEKCDSAAYSSKKEMLQGISVYSSRFDLCGKIDVFDSEKGILTERKKSIKTVYDGYVFQVYGQYFSLIDMGYFVKELRLYSMDNNKTYNIPLPEESVGYFSKFEKLLAEIKSFDFSSFRQDNASKCAKCIYEPLCSFSLLQGDN